MKVAIGQDSHRFDFSDSTKKLILGGIIIPNHPPLSGNSDADVILHSVTNAISGITCVNILGSIADTMCNSGVKDSSVYLAKALSYMDPRYYISHLSISIECKTPKLSPYIEDIRINIAKLLNIPSSCVGITATSGEGLTDFGRGFGIQVFSCITVCSKDI
ncbi:MAG: 2-C-methyl-D-erythritol 2,4-cyclodiphosphate synthase [Clostridiales bacterium]|nr:2-C-methyl-D-erythritol 2,4-cyclodiphosphate synthase [Clostridiales bacterium]